MGGQHDDVHAVASEPVDLGLHNFGHIRHHRHVSGAGDVGELRGGGADDADAPTLLLHHCRRGDTALIDQRSQGRFAGEVQVGADERRSGGLGDEPGQQVGAQVELVVADGQGVVADEVEGQCVVERAVVAEAHRKLGAAQEVVARGDGDHRRAVIGGLGPKLVYQGGEAGHAAVIGQIRRRLHQLRLAVVVVQDHQLQFAAVTGCITVVLRIGRHCAQQRGDQSQGDQCPHDPSNAHWLSPSCSYWSCV